MAKDNETTGPKVCANPECGKPFKGSNHRWVRDTYCSSGCWDSVKKKRSAERYDKVRVRHPARTCAIESCAKTFTPRYGTTIYCSDGCRRLASKMIDAKKADEVRERNAVARAIQKPATPPCPKCGAATGRMGKFHYCTNREACGWCP